MVSDERIQDFSTNSYSSRIRLNYHFYVLRTFWHIYISHDWESYLLLAITVNKFHARCFQSLRVSLSCLFNSSASNSSLRTHMDRVISLNPIKFNCTKRCLFTRNQKRDIWRHENEYRWVEFYLIKAAIGEISLHGNSVFLFSYYSLFLFSLYYYFLFLLFASTVCKLANDSASTSHLTSINRNKFVENRAPDSILRKASRK